MLALSLVSFVIMVVLDLLYGYFFFNFTFKNVDTLSKNPSKINFSFFVFRIISLGTYLIVDLDSSTGFIELLLVQIVVACVFMYDSLVTYTYHDNIVSKVNCIMTTTFFWANVSSFSLLASGITLFKENALVCVGLGSIFFVKLQLNIISFTENVKNIHAIT